MPRVLIVGYGNPLRGDDGVGWRVAERLRGMVHDPNVEILAQHQLAPELMETLSAAGRAIFIDAATGAAPGEVRERTVEPEGTAAAFTHHATPGVLLAGAKALYGRAPRATLITVTGADFSFSDELSPVVEAAVDDVVEMALRLI